MRISVVLGVVSSTWRIGSAVQLPRPSCVVLPAESSNVTTGSRGKGSVNYTCVFDPAAVTVTCKNAGSGMGITVTTVTSYKSKDDLVDTVSAIPPLVKSASLKLSGPGSMTSTTYTLRRPEAARS